MPDFNRLCIHCMQEADVAQGAPCPHCGRPFQMVGKIHHQLRPFSILQGKYLVGDVLGEGGFGITYVGLDINLEVKVAIKEFYPNGYATRESMTTNELTIYDGASKEAVEKWRDSFLQEARSLGKCAELSGVVGVRDFFQENNTAYIILEYLDGMTLKAYAKSLGGKIPARELLAAIEPVISSLGMVHKQGLIHRDISPDNIMLMPDGKMKLLDFGAAREYGNAGERSLSVMLKPGYAPEEQYRSKGNQGPWSDIYALAGTIYKCLTGVTPPESMERLRNDGLKSPRELGADLSSAEESALLKAMAVYAENRYQTMEEFHRDLYGQGAGTFASAASMTQSPNPAPFQGQAAQSVQSRAPLGNGNMELPKQPPASDKKWLPFIIGGGALGLILFLTLAGLAIRTMLRRGDTGMEGAQEANASLTYEIGDSEEADAASLPEENGKEGGQETPDAGALDEQLGEIESLLEEGREKIDEEDYYNGAVPCLEDGMDLCLSLGADYGFDERLAMYAQELYDEYELCILTYHVPMLEEQGLHPELYEQIDSELEELCGRADSLAEAGLLESERGDNARETLENLPEWYTRQYCLAFNEFTQRENWSRSEAWEMMSGAQEAGLIKEDDPDDALRLRYGYALARFTLKQNEENIEKGEYEEAEQRIMGILEAADYNPLLIIELYSLEEELGNEEGAEAAWNCLSDMQQTVYQMQGVDILDDPEHFWYFNDFGEYSVSDDNGLTPQARGRMRELGQYYYG